MIGIVVFMIRLIPLVGGTEYMILGTMIVSFSNRRRRRRLCMTMVVNPRYPSTSMILLWSHDEVTSETRSLGVGVGVGASESDPGLARLLASITCSLRYLQLK